MLFPWCFYELPFWVQGVGFFLKSVSLLVPASCQSSPSCLQLLPGMTPAVLWAGSLVDGPLLVQLARTVSGNHSSTSVCTVNIHTALPGRAEGEPPSSLGPSFEKCSFRAAWYGSPLISASDRSS